MKYSIVALSAFLVAAVSAQPHGRSPHAHRHADKHAKRELVMVTEYVDITETVLLTATVWVDGKGNTIAPPVTGAAISTAQGKPVTSSNSPAVFFEPAPTPTAAPPPPPPAPKVEEPKAAPPPPPPAPVVEEKPEPIVEAPPPPPPAKTTTIKIASAEPKPAPPPPPPAPVVEEPKPAPPPPPPAPVVEEPKPIVLAPAPAPQAEVAAGPQAAPATGSISGPCAPGSPCTGDVTFYQAGLGACGETHDGLAEAVVALPHGMMGTQSNGNPFCGRTVSITKNGKTTSATVVDKCMGCKDGDLDLSEKAFAALGIDQSVGRTTAEWHFTS